MAASVDLSELLITCSVMDTFGNLGDLTTCDFFHLIRWTSCRSGSPDSLFAAFSLIPGFLPNQLGDIFFFLFFSLIFFVCFFFFGSRPTFPKFFSAEQVECCEQGKSSEISQVERFNQSDIYVLILDSC